MFCPNCGNQTPDGGKFCASCGHALASPVQNSMNLQKKNKKSGKKWLVITAAVLIVVAIAVGAVAFLGGGKKEIVLVGREIGNFNAESDWENISAWEYEFDDDGNLESYTITTSGWYGDEQVNDTESVIEVEYDDKGRIDTVTVDSDGMETELTYIYEDGELVGIEGESDMVSYEATCQDGRVVEVEAQSEHGETMTITFDYDDAGNLVEYVQKMDSMKMVREYDENGNMIRMAYYQDGELFQETSYDYDDHGNMILTEYVYTDRTQTVEMEYTYEDDRIECVEVTVTVDSEYDDETVRQQYEMIYDWESDTEAVITYEGDDLENAYREDRFDDRGNRIYTATYDNDELISETTDTYMELTAKQQRQMEQIRWIVLMCGGTP